MLVFPKTIERPARYLGIEPNRSVKDVREGDVRFCLCYPDMYEIGMSYLGFFLLYELLNNLEGVWCERCFAPVARYGRVLAAEGRAPFYARIPDALVTDGYRRVFHDIRAKRDEPSQYAVAGGHTDQGRRPHRMVRLSSAAAPSCSTLRLSSASST